MDILQIEPPLPLRTADGLACMAYFLRDYGLACMAYFLRDYGIEHDTYFLCGMKESRELWWIAQKHLRLDTNISLDRNPLLPTESPAWRS